MTSAGFEPNNPSRQAALDRAATRTGTIERCETSKECHVRPVIFISNFFRHGEYLTIIRQDDDDLSRRVLLSEPRGRRPRGRPKLRWEDGVVEDAARLGRRN
jgi:hypothetical protein